MRPSENLQELLQTFLVLQKKRTRLLQTCMRLAKAVYYLSPVVNAIRMISLTDDLREIAAICSENVKTKRLSNATETGKLPS